MVKHPFEETPNPKKLKREKMLFFEDGHYLLFQDPRSLMNEMRKTHELDQMTFRNVFTLFSTKWTCAGMCAGVYRHSWRRAVLDLLDLEVQVIVNYLTWMLGSQLRLLQQQCVLLKTEPSSLVEQML